MRVVRIFLSSPGDCKRERNAISHLVARINVDPLISKQARVEVVRWDWAPGVPMEALEPPQKSVDAFSANTRDMRSVCWLIQAAIWDAIAQRHVRRFDGKRF